MDFVVCNVLFSIGFSLDNKRIFECVKKGQEIPLLHDIVIPNIKMNRNYQREIEFVFYTYQIENLKDKKTKQIEKIIVKVPKATKIEDFILEMKISIDEHKNLKISIWKQSNNRWYGGTNNVLHEIESKQLFEQMEQHFNNYLDN